MTNFRRFSTALAATLMAATLSVPMAMNVSALEGTGTGSIVITTDTDVTHSKLTAYQIFTANASTAGVVITGWGDGIDVAALGVDLKSNTTIGSSFENVNFAGSGDDEAASAQAASDVISGLSAGDAEIFAKIVAANVTGTGTQAVVSGTTATVSGLPTGYYIVVDAEAASNGDYSAYTLGILKVVDNQTTAITGNTKVDFPQFDKQIGDINDTDTVAGTYSYDEAADHDMGDKVPFRLIATVPENIDDYDAYQMIFHDNLQKDVFTFSNDVKVTYFAPDADVDTATGTSVTAFSVATENLSATNSFSGKNESETTEDFTVTLADITAIDGLIVEAGGYFVVDYTATLTTSANLGAAGNWNSAYLEYSNNPNYTADGTQSDSTANSPEDSVVAFTYQVVVDKIDAITKEALPGATFKLEKVLEGGTKNEIAVVKANEDATFVFTGLDDGTYILTEVSAPSNSYNKINPITFEITASETQTDGSEALTSLTAKTTDDSDQTATFEIKNAYVLETVDEKTSAETGDVANGAVYTKVENSKGTSLPGTGGIGTAIFTLGGGAMVAIAGIYLISKKRMKNEEE